jgi:hypothetical protein
LRKERVKEIAAALRIVFADLSKFRRAREDDGSMLDEAIMIALGDATGLTLEPRQLSLIEMHEDSHDPALVKKTKNKRNSVAIFQGLHRNTRNELLAVAGVSAKKGISNRAASDVIESLSRSGES